MLRVAAPRDDQLIAIEELEGHLLAVGSLEALDGDEAGMLRDQLVKPLAAPRVLLEVAVGAVARSENHEDHGPIFTQPPVASRRSALRAA